MKKATGREVRTDLESPGLALMVFLASGEDPNFGMYSNNVRRAVRSIVSGQDANTGYLGNSMYHHGFGMLALAEAYGAVDDRHVWPGGKKPRSIGAALELAVRAAITSQRKNPLGAWRYSPDGADADTSVSGAVLVGLLGVPQRRDRGSRRMHRQSNLLLHEDDRRLRTGGLLRRPRRIR